MSDREPDEDGQHHARDLGDAFAGGGPVEIETEAEPQDGGDRHECLAHACEENADGDAVDLFDGGGVERRDPPDGGDPDDVEQYRQRRR